MPGEPLVARKPRRLIKQKTEARDFGRFIGSYSTLGVTRSCQPSHVGDIKRALAVKVEQRRSTFNLFVKRATLETGVVFHFFNALGHGFFVARGHVARRRLAFFAGFSAFEDCDISGHDGIRLKERDWQVFAGRASQNCTRERELRALPYHHCQFAKRPKR